MSFVRKTSDATTTMALGTGWFLGLGFLVRLAIGILVAVVVLQLLGK